MGCDEWHDRYLDLGEQLAKVIAERNELQRKINESNGEFDNE